MPTQSYNPTPTGLIRPELYDELCGSWMPRAKTWCARKPHSTGKFHMTIDAVEHGLAKQRERNTAKYPRRMLDTSRRVLEKAYQDNKYERRSQMLSHIKLMQGCTDCGYDKHPAALDFDHLPGTEKANNVPNLIMGSLKKVFEEIDKCEVVCSNCHRIRTSERGQWKRPTTPIPHGTPGGYSKHRRMGVPVCKECQEAYDVKQTEYRVARKLREAGNETTG